MLAAVLQEDKMFARMAIYKPQFYYTTPLNRMVDVARPESYLAYRFGQNVDLWIASEDTKALERITAMLENWSSNHVKLAPAFENNERLQEVQAHSEHLSQLADAALAALTDPESLKGKEQELADLFASASLSYAATIMPVAGHVQKLVQTATKK